MASNGAAGATGAASNNNAARTAASAEMEATAVRDFSNILSFINGNIPKQMQLYNKLFLAIGAADLGLTSIHNLLELFRYQLHLFKGIPKSAASKITHFVLVIDPELKNPRLVEDQVTRINKFLKDDYEDVFPDFKLQRADQPNLFKSANRSVYYWFSPVELVSDYRRPEGENIVDFRKRIISMGVPGYAQSCVPKRESWHILSRICKETPFNQIYSYNCAFFDTNESFYKNGKVIQIKYKSNIYYEDICELLYILYQTKKRVFILDRVMGGKIVHPEREVFKLFDFNFSPVITKNRLNNTTRFLAMGGKQTRRLKKKFKLRQTKVRKHVS